MKARRGEERYSSSLSLTSALDGVGGQRHAPATLPTGKRPANHCIGGWVSRSRWVLKIFPHPQRDLIPGPSSFCPYFPRLLSVFDRNGLWENGAGSASTVVLRRAGHSVWTGLHDITFTSVHFPWRQFESDWLDHEVKAVESYRGQRCLTCDAGKYARCREHLPPNRYVSYSWKHALSFVWFTFGVIGLLKVRLNIRSALANEDVRLFESLCCRVRERENVKFAHARACVCVVNFLVADKQFFHLQLIHVVNMPSKETRKQTKAVVYDLFNLL